MKFQFKAKKRPILLSRSLLCFETWNWVYIKYKIQSPIRCFSRFQFIFYKTIEFFSKFQDFSTSLGKLYVLPRVSQGPGRRFQKSGRFLGIPGVVSNTKDINMVLQLLWTLTFEWPSCKGLPSFLEHNLVP